MERIRKFLKENKTAVNVAVTGVAVPVASVLAYSYVCKKNGYYMCKPHQYNIEEKWITAQSITGKILKSDMND